MTYTSCCLYTVDPPDNDEQQACSKRVVAYYWNKLIANSASCWFMLYRENINCVRLRICRLSFIEFLTQRYVFWTVKTNYVHCFYNYPTTGIIPTTCFGQSGLLSTGSSRSIRGFMTVRDSCISSHRTETKRTHCGVFFCSLNWIAYW